MRQDSHAPSVPVSTPPVPEDPLLSRLSRSLPWVISLLFHLSVVLIMMFVVMISVPSNATESYPDPIVPELGVECDMPPVTDALPDPETPRVETNPEERRSLEDIKHRMEKPLPDVLGTFGASTGQFNPLGKRESFRAPGIMDRRPAAGNVHNVVFVIDRSGSMVGTFDHVRNELSRSIGRMLPKQNFHVIFFAEGKPQQLKTRRLLEATPANKQKAVDFLKDITAQGRTDVLPALKEAFRVLNGATKRGKLIYLLTDGDFRGKEPAVMQFLRQANKNQDVHITTFLYGNVMNHTASKTLKQIAAENGGHFHAVPYEE